MKLVSTEYLLNELIECKMDSYRSRIKDQLNYAL